MKTIAIINQKGGVGKSTTAIFISLYLRNQNKKVLLCDIDQQGNTTAYFNQDILDTKELFNMDTIVNCNGVDVLPANIGLTIPDNILIGVGRESKLKEALESVSGNYDYCIIDCPPSLNILTVNALTVANGVLLPSFAERFSIQGLSQAITTIENVKKYCNPDLKILGVLFTRFKTRGIYSNTVAEELEELVKQYNTKVYKPRIRETVAINEAIGIGADLLSYAPNSGGIRDYMEFLEAFSKDIEEL